ncbi:LGFP repeat-containing protein, partial [Modestobacter sp. SYSU DS0511]
MTAPGPLRPARRRTARALLAVACAAVGLTALLAGSGPGAQPTALVEAADTSQFRAGNIISDQLFYDGNAMSAADVQTFLNSKNPNCKPSSAGVPCLKNATQDTYTRPADSRCPGTYVGARAETAATIIAKVGKACGISQRVLLVILQKEQGLVTLSGDKLTVTRYEKAMGFGCPDTAPCNPAYAHLFNQLYSAARQYQDYRLAPRAIKAGIVNQIRWHPNAGCGSSAVFVENWATAGLYTYTPYQPNAAALRAGSGTGDGCSAYGNRNFWIYYTDWFGSTQVPGAANVTSRYAATGGTTGPLGAIQGSVACGLVGGGCLQHYAKGTIYWSPATGAQIVLYGAARDKWGSTGWERGPLGYPVRDGVCGLPSGGCFQAFQKGSVYWSSATGARVLSGAVLEKWGTTGWERGPLGYPVSDVTSLAGGVQFAHFQGGSVYWSQGTGARVVSGVV